jgi:transcriptional regulator with XRE-family HTH domain
MLNLIKKKYLVKLGENVRTLRRARKLTQERLAERSERSRDLISLIERGECAPSIETVVKIAKALGEDAQNLLEGI